jgi:hypothetical protein
MLETIADLDAMTAVGVLSRAALSIHDDRNPESKARLPNEFAIRDRLLREVRKALGVDATDSSGSTLERVTDFLDSESESLLEPVDEKSTLVELANQGTLPSDLYQVELKNEVARVYADKFVEERQLIIATVHQPDVEQHYGPRLDPRQPTAISLFLRRFPDPYAAKTFWLLVVGSRRGLILDVGQSWRIYAEMIDPAKVTEPLDALRLFSEKYGLDLRCGGRSAKFFVHEILSPPDTNIDFRVSQGELDKAKGKPLEASGNAFFTSFADGRSEVSMANNINVGRYRETLRQRGW